MKYIQVWLPGIIAVNFFWLTVWSAFVAHNAVMPAGQSTNGMGILAASSFITSIAFAAVACNSVP